MDSPTLLFLLLPFSYVLGSVPCGLLVVRLLGGVDPRGVGSGNIGATNVLRTSGKAAGALTLLGDVGKGALPVCLALALALGPYAVAAVGLSAFLGHLFPIFLRFKGGKGVATACGVFLVISPVALGVSALVLVFVVAVTRYVSVGSMSAAVALPMACAFTSSDPAYVWLAVAVAILIVFKHSENIKRLIRGTEGKLGGTSGSSGR